jgi:hypothetical protein
MKTYKINPISLIRNIVFIVLAINNKISWWIVLCLLLTEINLEIEWKQK